MRFIYLIETRRGYVTRRNWRKAKVELAGNITGAWKMSYGLYRDGLYPYGWDMPTFKSQSERIV